MSNPQSFSPKNPQTTPQLPGKQPTEKQRTCKATKATGHQSSAPALFGDMQLVKPMFAYEKHEHRVLLTCSTCSLQIQHRAAWFNITKNSDTLYKICRNSSSFITSFEEFNKNMSEEPGISFPPHSKYLEVICLVIVMIPLEWSSDNWHFFPHKI